jgi:DNA-binding NarL/FixJ family response regulator
MAVALTLAAVGLARFDAPQHAHLTPPDVASADEWRAAVNARPRELFEATSAAFAMAGALDALGFALQVRAADSRVLHETPALARLLARDAESAKLRDTLSRVAAMVAGCLTRATQPRQPGPGGSAHREVHTALAGYRVAGAALSMGTVDGHGSLLIGVERVMPDPLSDAELRDRYRLTSREIQVARLMADALPNPEIARRLGTSIHTERRHAERVLLKLGVRRRGEVAGKLQAP